MKSSNEIFDGKAIRAKMLEGNMSLHRALEAVQLQADFDANRDHHLSIPPYPDHSPAPTDFEKLVAHKMERGFTREQAEAIISRQQQYDVAKTAAPAEVDCKSNRS